MKRVLHLAVACSAMCSLVAFAAAAESSQPETAKGAILTLETDSRLRGKVSLPKGIREFHSQGTAWRGPVDLVLKQARQACSLALVRQDTFLQEQLTIALPEGESTLSAASLLRSVAVSLNATWAPVQGDWVLTDVPPLASFLTRDPRTRLIGLPAALGQKVRIGELLPFQLDILRRGGRIVATQLRPHQQQAASIAVLRAYLNPGGRQRVAPEAFRLAGVYLALPDLQHPETQTGLVELGLWVPRADGAGTETAVNIPLDRVQVGTARPASGVVGPPNPVPLPIAEALFKAPSRSRDEEERYRADTRLDRPLPRGVRLSGQPLTKAVTLSAGTAGLFLVLASALETRPISATAELATVRDAMRVVEERTGGRWIPVGEGYALRPDPRIERVARSIESFRMSAASDALTAFQRGLSRQTLAILHRRKSLDVADLKDTERAGLRAAALLAFGSRPDVAYRALELSGIQISLLEPSEERRSEWGVQYQLPSPNGTFGEPVVIPLR